MSVTVRSATNADSPAIWQAIVESYVAIVDSTHASFLPYFEKAGYDAREQDLKDIEKEYIQRKDSHFWVAEHSELGVVGCVAIKRTNADEGELKRMAVNSALRGHGTGKLLFETLLSFAKAAGFLRITLTTINHRAAHFYKKMGFISSRERPMSMPPAEGVVGYSMVYYLGDKFIRNVTIIGGTHGNERIGVALARHWQQHEKQVRRPSFTTTVLVGNEQAAQKNVRYVDVDLNRCFDTGAPPVAGVEAARAAELQKLLGPKSDDAAFAGSDFIIDLHSSTSNMGLSLVMNMENDIFAHRVAQAMSAAVPDLKLTGSPGSKASTYSIDSIAASGLAIEVGPQAHGTVRHGLLAHTKTLVFAALDYIEKHNQALLALVGAGAEQVQHRGRMFVFSRAVAPPLPIPLAPFYERVATVDYPRGPGGEQIGFISPKIDGKDWAPVSAGDELFVDADGTPLSYALPTPPSRMPPWIKVPPAQLYAVFINEAAYFEKGIAMALCQLSDLAIY